MIIAIISSFLITVYPHEEQDENYLNEKPIKEQHHNREVDFSREISKEQEEINLVCFEEKKQNHFSLFCDCIYFKATTDNLNYAEKVPQNATFTPTVKSISQEFDYKPGFRTGVSYAFNKLWNIQGIWTHYRTRPPSKHAFSSDFGILATLATPVWGGLGNSNVNEVNGRWRLLMNIVDLDVSCLFKCMKFSINAIAGIKGAIIDQKIKINYGDFLLEFPLQVAPHLIEGKSRFWGIGPSLGAEFRYFIYKNFKLFALGQLSCLTGVINTKTFYKDFSTETVDVPANSVVKIEDPKILVSLFEQFQIGIDQRWIFKKWAFEIAGGWEVQVLRKQVKFNFFSTFVTPPSQADLNLYGPFLRMKVDF